MNKIWIIEDDASLARLISENLTKWGYPCEAATNFDQLDKEFLSVQPQLIILDVSLPGKSGHAWCAEIRKLSKVPILFLSSHNENLDIIMALNQGGDDYLTKPFRPTVLLMRVKALLRRVEMERGGDPLGRDITVGDLRFSGDEKRLFCREKPLALSPNELKMLIFLMRGEGKAFSRDELLTYIWGYNDEVETRVTDETLRRIRSKLSSADSKVQIETVWGYGYRLRSDGGSK